jgi:hypothetical protein
VCSCYYNSEYVIDGYYCSLYFNYSYELKLVLWYKLSWWYTRQRFVLRKLERGTFPSSLPTLPLPYVLHAKAPVEISILIVIADVESLGD